MTLIVTDLHGRPRQNPPDYAEGHTVCRICDDKIPRGKSNLRWGIDSAGEPVVRHLCCTCVAAVDRVTKRKG